MSRIATGKAIGFVVGLAGFVFVPYFLPDAGWQLHWGILLWYTTFGAVIGMAGVLTSIPVLNLALRSWVRGAVLGAWLNFVLVFFAYDLMAALLVSVFGEGGVLGSPFWFAAEGAIVGFVIDHFATRAGGEGPETVSR
jgi:hypothetical protein